MQTQSISQNHTLVDQVARDRFCKETEVNFSVIASAGVGKTTAIVERIVNLIINDKGNNASQLVVVTYTQKAATEMHQRVYQQLIRKTFASQSLLSLNKAFFGTIHSFCLNLLKNYGYYLGLATNFQLLTNKESLWLEFIRNSNVFDRLLHTPLAESIFKYLSLDKVLSLAKQVSPSTPTNDAILKHPRIDIDTLLKYKPKRKTTTLDEHRAALSHWHDSLSNNLQPIGIPNFNQGSADLKSLCAETFFPLWAWLGQASLHLSVTVAQVFQEYRLSKGFINYDDMVSLALKLLGHPEAANQIQAKEYRVILDEAQDTDKDQFSVLLGVAHGTQDSDDRTNSLPGPGRFSMVGDPQQSIYSSRADLPTYLKIHKKLTENNIADTLTFSVTMRCDIKVVGHVNSLFPSLLNSVPNRTQVDFVPLSARPWANNGQVLRLQLHKKNDVGETVDPITFEANHLAQWLLATNKKDLGIEQWNQVAILCPRKSWLTSIAKALSQKDLPSQIYSSDDMAAHNPAYAWTTALITIMAFPTNSFEIIGVLRDVFGLSDDSLAWYIRWWEKTHTNSEDNLHPINISNEVEQTDPVAEALNVLHGLRNTIKTLPLRDAFCQCIECIQLKERILKLPDYHEKEILNTLEYLQINAILAEQEGLTLADWALQLQKNLNASLYQAPSQQDAIELITCHKSKGLEWDIVIVPYLFRSISFPAEAYPQLFCLNHSAPPEVAISAHPAKRRLDEKKALHRKDEFERLLYVTATRARNALIWVDDEPLFSNTHNSLADTLKFRFNSANRTHWDALPFEFESQEQFKSFEPLAINLPKYKNHKKPNITKALQNGNRYVRRWAPSSLARGFGPINSTQSSATPSLLSLEYGNWWHNMMENMPWNAGKDEWKKYFGQYIGSCPLSDRGQQEIALFVASPLINIITQPNVTRKTELPFFWKKSDSSAYDGQIDLLLFNSLTNSYSIIDWKTDEIGADDLPLLYEKHGQQVSIYKEAVAAISGTSPQTFIYSTCLGKTTDPI